MKRFVTLFACVALCFQAFAVEYGVVDLSVCNIRSTPAYSAELVTQALLGTPVHVLGVEKGWPHIQTPDGYTGYVNRDAVKRMTKDQYHEWNAAPKVMVTSLFAIVRENPCEYSGTVSDVVGGCRLMLLDGVLGYWHVRFPGGREGYISTDDAIPDEQFRENVRQDADAIIETAMSMMGFPYLWGGTSPKGFDCSGYVRTVLALHGIIMPRDAGQQAPVTERIDTSHGIDKLERGDLVFFGNKDTGRVRHVGFYLGGGRFLHCIGKAHINSLLAGDPDYDDGNSPTLLYGGRFLHLIDKKKEINTYWTNPYYLE